MGESSESSRPVAKGARKRERVEHFEEMVEWARANGWSDFDFEGIERRVVELARVMRETPRQTTSSPVKRTEKLIRFASKLPTRKSKDV